MDRKTMNAIRRLREMGATHIRIGGVEVKFGAAPSVAQTPQQIVDEALAEFREAVADEREVDDLKDKARRREQLARLRYAHSD